MKNLTLSVVAVATLAFAGCTTAGGINKGDSFTNAQSAAALATNVVALQKDAASLRGTEVMDNIVCSEREDMMTVAEDALVAKRKDARVYYGKPSDADILAEAEELCSMANGAEYDKVEDATRGAIDINVREIERMRMYHVPK